jgi:hypothetical protein
MEKCETLWNGSTGDSEKVIPVSYGKAAVSSGRTSAKSI